MDSLLKLLRENAALKPAQLAAMLNLPESDVLARIRTYEAERVILGYHAILDDEKLGVETSDDSVVQINSISADEPRKVMSASGGV